jgi:hypothetical protein
VVKFLRHSQPGATGVNEERRLDVPDDLDTAETQAPESEFAVRSVLNKMDILRDRSQKIRFLKKVARLSSPWVPRILLDLLADPSEEIRDFAAKELAGRDDLTPQNLYDRLFQPPWYGKSATLWILAKKKDLECVKHIKLVLADPNVDVRRSAASALGEIGGSEARALLVRLARDKNPYVRAAATQALEKLCDFKFS